MSTNTVAGNHFWSAKKYVEVLDKLSSLDCMFDFDDKYDFSVETRLRTFLEFTFAYIYLLRTKKYMADAPFL